MITTANVNNGRPRKQLGDQIDRFEALLDGLSEGLNDALADAAREGTRLAVKDAIVELLTDPELRARLHQATAPPAEPAKISFWARIKARAAAAVRGVAASAARTAEAARNLVRKATRATTLPIRAIRMLGDLRKLLGFAIASGLVIAAVTYVAPHVIAAGMSGMSGAIAAIAVQVGVRAGRAVRLAATAP